MKVRLTGNKVGMGKFTLAKNIKAKEMIKLVSILCGTLVDGCKKLSSVL